MSPDQFKDYYQQTPSPTVLAGYEAIRSYHRITEEYDRTVCSGQSYGEAFPVGNHELMLVNQFASKTKRRIQMEIGINDADWRTANNHYVKNDLARDLQSDWGRR